jgi:hypothetical protein
LCHGAVERNFLRACGADRIRDVVALKVYGVYDFVPKT